MARWDSRRHRKHPPGAPAAGSTWRAPRARGSWIAVLFAIGSLLFALGAVPGYASAVGASWDALTFFIGSLFFTAAGFSTYREAVDAGTQPVHATRRRFLVFQPGRIDWRATVVQLAGTVFFNVRHRGRVTLLTGGCTKFGGGAPAGLHRCGLDFLTGG